MFERTHDAAIKIQCLIKIKNIYINVHHTTKNGFSLKNEPVH